MKRYTLTRITDRMHGHAEEFDSFLEAQTVAMEASLKQVNLIARLYSQLEYKITNEGKFISLTAPVGNTELNLTWIITGNP